MRVPPRWLPLQAYLQVLLAPLVDLGAGGWFAIEAAGPDGGRWTKHRREYVDLASPEPELAALRAVARLCGASSAMPDPDGAGQDGCGLYYSPAALSRLWRSDQHAVALAAIVLDIDDRDHGGREGTMRATAAAPVPTALVRSGGGVQAAYVLREALRFDRTDPVALEQTLRAYLKAAKGLEALTDADVTAWPSHLFRCPGTYHLKVPTRPVLVEVEVDPARRFNLSDFDDFAEAADPLVVDEAVPELRARLLGAPRPERSPTRPGRRIVCDPGTSRPARVDLPRRVSRQVIGLLNTGWLDRVARPDGATDRSRGVYVASLSLLAAGLDEEEVASCIAVSALRGAIEDRGSYGPRWLRHQVARAKAHLRAHPRRVAR